MSTERLQKILARAGLASRRAAEEIITAGRVRVNGQIVRELGTKADSRNDKIEVDGSRIIREASTYLIVHKPRGYVSTMSDPEGRPAVAELLKGTPVRVYPIGRLDFATSGVLLATNDGTFADGLMHPKRDVPKTYVLKVKGLMSPEDVAQWSTGVRLEDGMTKPAEAKLIRHEEDKTWLELTISEGRNQQIRRMGDATGFRVMRLARTSFAGISSEGLRPGEWRFLTRDELSALKKTYGVPEKLPSADHGIEAADKPAARGRGHGMNTHATSRDGARERARKPSARDESPSRERRGHPGAKTDARARPTSEGRAGRNTHGRARSQGVRDDAPRPEVRGGFRGRARATVGRAPSRSPERPSREGASREGASRGGASRGGASREGASREGAAASKKPRGRR